jgi:fructokinase
MRMKSAPRGRSRSSELRAVGSGLIALDVILDETSFPITSAVGGSAGNVLAALAYLGWNSVPVCELGKDEAAEKVRNEFQKLKADLRFLVQREEACTPVVYQMPADKHKSETHTFSFRCPTSGEHRGFSPPSDAELSEKVYQDVPRPSVFYFDRVTDVSLDLAEKYRATGVLVVFEPSAVPSDLEDFQRAISATHILKYADNRFDEFPHDVSNVLLEIKTMGAQGLQFRIPSVVGSWTSLPAINVLTVADTAGAGDWCTAGLLASLFDAGGLPDISYDKVYDGLRFGQSLAAANCMFTGARGVTERWTARQMKLYAEILMKKSAISGVAALPQGRKKTKMKVAQPLSSELFEF